jgi:hypothetical protein
MNCELDIDKSKQLILHICKKMENVAGFGSVVLAKVLFYTDHSQYLEHGRTITGFKYIKQKNGATPAPAQFLPLRDDLIREGKLIIRETPYLGRIQKRPVAREFPNLSVFSPEEVSVIDSIIEYFKDANATMASELSHDELGWQLAAPREEIPPCAYLLTEAEVDDSDIEWAEQQIEEYQRETAVR